MAERTAVWKIVAQYSQARKEARDLKKEHEGLREERDRLNESDKESLKTDKAREKSNRSLLSQVKEYAKRTREAADSSERSARATKASAEEEANLVEVRRKLQTATLSQQRAELGLAEAKARLTRVEKEASASSEKNLKLQKELAAALKNQARVQKEAASESNRLKLARNQLTLAESRLASASKAAGEASAAANKKAGQSVAALEAAKTKAAAASVRAQQAELRVNSARLAVARAVEATQRDQARAEAQVASLRERAARQSESATRSLKSAQQGVAEAVARVAQAESRAAAATEGLHRAQERLGGGGSNVINNFKRLRAEFDGAGTAARKFVSFLGLLKFPAIIIAVRTLLAAVSALGGGFVALVSSIGPVVGVLGSLPQLFLGAASGVGALFLAFGGIGTALKAYGAQQKAAAREGAKSAQSEIQNARRIRDAQRSLRDAREAQAESAVSSARNIASAQRTLQDAYRAQSDAARESAESVVAAERRLADAQLEARDAQQDLTRARAQAREGIEDLKRSIQDMALTEERASLSVEEARARLIRTLNDPGSTALERRDAELSVREAEARLKDIQRQAQESQKELQSAQKAGVEGSDEVVQARRRQAEANRSVVEAQNALTIAIREGNQRQADSAQAVADAQIGLKDAYADSAKAQRDAAENVQSAIENLADAYEKNVEKTGAAATAAADFAEAMKKIGPEGRAFVKQLLSMQPLLDKLRATAMRGILPGVTDALRRSVGLFPIVNKGLDLMAKSIGNTARQGGILLTSGPFRRDFATIFKSNARIADTLGRTLLNVIDSLRNVTVAAIPLTEWLARVAEGWSVTARKSAEAGRTSGRMAKFFEQTRVTLTKLGKIFGNLIRGLTNVGKAGYAAGQSMLDTFIQLTDKFLAFTRSTEGQNKIKKYFEDIRPALAEMGKLAGLAASAFIKLGADPNLAPLLKQIREDLVPALGKLSQAVSGDFGNALVNALTALVEIFADLAKAGGGLTIFLQVFGQFLHVVGNIVEAVPGAAQALGIFLAAMGGFRALKLLSIVTGLSALTKQIALLGAVSAGKNATQLGKFVAGLKVLGSTAGGFAGSFGGVGTRISGFVKQSERATKAIARLTSAVRVGGVLVAGLAATGFVLKQLQDRALGVVPSLEDVTKTLQTMNKATDLSSTLPNLGQNLEYLSAQIRRLTDPSLGDKASKLFTKVFTLGQVDPGKLRDAQQNLHGIDEALTSLVESGHADQAVRAFNLLKQKAEEQGVSVATLNKVLPEYNKAMGDSVALAVSLPTPIEEANKALEDQESALKETTTAWDRYNGVNISAAQAQIDFQETLKGITDSVKTNGKALDGNSESALNNRTAILRAYEAAKSQAEAYAKSTGNAKDFDGALKSNVKALEEQLRKAGLTEAQIKKLTLAYGQVPGDVKTKLDADEKTAWAKIQETKARLADPKLTKPERSKLDIDKKKWDAAYAAAVKEKQRLGIPLIITAEMRADARKTARVSVEKDKNGNITSVRFANGVQALASGGRVFGAGTPTSDSVPARLSRDEHVLSAKEVKGFGGHRVVETMRAMAKNREWPKFAKGGHLGQVYRFATGGSLGSRFPGSKIGDPRPDLKAAADRHTPSILAQVAKAAAIQAERLAESLLGGAFDVGSGNYGPPNFHGAAANTAAAVAFILRKWGLPSGTWRAQGSVPGSDHPRGKASDTMIPNYRSQQGIDLGNDIASWFVHNPKNFGTKYVIWRDHINSGRGWVPYQHPAGNDDTLQHRNHVHVSYLKDGGRPGEQRLTTARDVPAMLRRGEFVINADAASKIGLGPLQALNSVATPANPGPSQANGVQYFHSGGPVQGIQSHTRGNWVKALQTNELLPPTGAWDNVLSNAMRGSYPGPLKLGATEGKFGNLIVSWLNAAARPLGFEDIRKRLGVGESNMLRLARLLRQGVINHVSRTKRSKYIAETDQKWSTYQTWVTELRKKLGLSATGGWDATMQPGLTHALDHAFGKQHDPYAERPWGPLDAAEVAARDQIRANQLNAEYRNYLIQFASWGLQDLVDKLFDLGPADGMEIARAAAKDRTKATALNAAYKDAKQYEGDAGRDIIKFIGTISASPTPLGLRDIARSLQAPDYAVVQLFDKARSSLSSVPAEKLTRLIADIDLFRKGLFYANSGGHVPGAGNRDSVPAMLTPGEYVLRKQAVAALGPEMLYRMNHFAAGGPVLTMPAPSLPGLSRASMVSGREVPVSVENEYRYEINTVINNPVGEASVASMNRNLKRQASLGVFRAGQESG